jgi:hypothetical protein
LSEILSSAKKQKKQARALLDLFYREGQQKEAIQAADVWRRSDELLKKTQTPYRRTMGGDTKSHHKSVSTSCAHRITSFGNA